MLRRIVIWTGPVAAMAVLVVGGFLYWALGTTSGGRWALVTTVMQFDGAVSGVSGSVWHGLQIGHLELPTDTLTVELRDFDLNVEWPALLQRELHIRNLSVGQLDIALTTDDAPKDDSAPFSMPELPVRIRADHVAVDHFSMSINNEALPVNVADFAASAYLTEDQGQLRLGSLTVGHDQADVRLEADVLVLDLRDPWPFDVELMANVRGKGEDSVLCARRYLATLPQPGEGYPETCSADVRVTAQGSLQELAMTATGSGQGMDLDAHVNLAPTAVFPLKDGRIDLKLADESSLHLDVDWIPGDPATEAGRVAAADTVRGSLRATQLNVGQLVGPSLPSAVLSTTGSFELQLKDRSELLSTRVELEFDEGTIWNDLPLTGLLKAHIEGGQTRAVPLWQSVNVHDLDIDLQLGKNHVRAGGGFGAPDSDLAVQLQAPALASFWPGLPGGIELDAQLRGSVAEHALVLDTTYTPAESEPGILGRAPAQLSLEVTGGWKPVDGTAGSAAGLQGWIGQIRKLDAGHAGLGLSVTQSPDLRLLPGSTAADGLWRLGSAHVELRLDTRPVLQLNHDASSGGAGGQWATAGSVSQLLISQELINDIQEIAGRAKGGSGADREPQRGGVKLRDANANASVPDLSLALDWNLRFDQALSGSLNARRLSGDMLVPAQPPFPLGLETLDLAVSASPQGGGRSRLGADLTVVTAQMGRASARLVAGIQATAGGGFGLDTQGATVDIDAAIDDLGWVSLFAGDAMEFGGKILADVQLVSRAGGWDSSGTITGENVRIVRIDDGIRLLDGTLSARLEGDRVILERLEFPARLRVEPKEWRTAEWVSTNPDARDGYLRLSGEWRLSDTAGDVDIELHRYPVLQRADRYAMVTGALHVRAVLPALSITGRVVADAGWIDLDMLGGIPTVDGDVVIIRGDDIPSEDVDVPMDISMDIEVDLGPRVYLTGYGVNSGLVGNMRVMMVDNKLTAIGALRTRGGAIEAYGQRLQLRRGTITFQGDIASPILSIEALRTGQPVEAGVRVSGTARRPSINLVSYPDVSELEKLSWLLFGHGPDESGGDMALLLSVGTSFLGDGEPFYRKFGIDELSLQSGDIGSAGSILPAESVVSGLNTGASDLERQFISASKGVTAGLTLSVRQALSDAGTVGRVSYRLARGLTAELSVGTVNGLALVYRWFSRQR